MLNAIDYVIGARYGVVVRDGDRIVSMSSQNHWYRLFRALADLFIAGEIDADQLSNGIPHDQPDQYDCPAAQHVLRSIYLALDEPDCLHDPYSETRCTCSPMDRRARLRELLGA